MANVAALIQLPAEQSETSKVHQLEVACAELKSLPDTRAVYAKRGSIFFGTTIKAATKSQLSASLCNFLLPLQGCYHIHTEIQVPTSFLLRLFVYSISRSLWMNSRDREDICLTETFVCTGYFNQGSWRKQRRVQRNSNREARFSNLHLYLRVRYLMTMALTATCSHQSLQYLGVGSASVGCSETAHITLTHQQICWSKTFQTQGLGILRNKHFSQCLRRPKRQHFVWSRKANLRTQRSRRVSSCPPSTLSSERSVQLGSLHQCEALPARLVEGDEEEGSPWEGAVLFRRSAVQSRFEYNTSLESLGLSRLSSEISSSLTLSMGLKASKSDGEFATPVEILVDVSREGRGFRLDGVIRTAFTLVCNRCLAPVAERVFANFSVLLSEKPIEEPAQQSLGVVLGGNSRIWGIEAEDDSGEVHLDLDLDDKLHFPVDVKEIDLSKYLRDTIHLEIPSKSLCESACQGLCLGCGVNLNIAACKCRTQKKSKNMNLEDIMGINKRKDVWGPLEQLKKQLEEQQGEANDS